MKNSKGFTLIELLAVILILGVIALIAIPSVNSVIKQSRKGADQSTGNEMVRAARMYHSTCEINGGVTVAGDKCFKNFRAHKEGEDFNNLWDNTKSTNDLTDATLKTTLELKGDLPKMENIEAFQINITTGNVYLKYTKDGFTCSNFEGDEADITSELAVADSVTCQ